MHTIQDSTTSQCIDSLFATSAFIFFVGVLLINKTFFGMGKEILNKRNNQYNG